MIKVAQNLFVGVNPHLISLFQSTDEVFDLTFAVIQKSYVVHIHDFLNKYLPENYVAITRQSIQEWERDGIRWIAGVDIVEISAGINPIYAKSVVRIEVLTPENMSGEIYGAVYQQNRALLDIPIIEIDYLHEYLSPVRGVPRYPDKAGSKPFYIAFSNPAQDRPDMYLFGINEPIPTLPIQLAGNEVLNFDFGESFAYTWETSRFEMFVDYDTEPRRMENYSPADQAIIRAHLATIRQQYAPS